MAQSQTATIEVVNENSDVQSEQGTAIKHDFLKMHGLGNDFIIFDAREIGLEMQSLRARSLADRSTGIGCDQLIVLRKTKKADVFMEIWNADGSRVGACGNATRCVADIIADECGRDNVVIETDAGLLAAQRQDGVISVDMGPPKLDWQSIPLFQSAKTDYLDLKEDGIPVASCVSMGNPHAVFFVDKVMAVDLELLGPKLETHWMFPEKANISFVEVQPDRLRVRVWERGAGITRACGTAACAALVAATRRELIGREALVTLDGGDLTVRWSERNGHVIMTGPSRLVFKGSITLDELDVF